MRRSLILVLCACLSSCSSCGGGGGGGGAAPIPAQLAFLVQPRRAPAGQPLLPVVEVGVLDAGGTLVPGASNAVTLELEGPPGTNLSGTLTVSAVGGVARFPDVAADTDGSGFALRASAVGLVSASSVLFEVGFPNIQRTIEVEPRGFVVDGVLRKALGVVYAPFPVGTDGSFDYTGDARLRTRDFPAIAELGSGTVIRVPAAVSDPDFLDDAAASGLDVFAGFFIEPTADFTDPTVRLDLAMAFRTFVPGWSPRGARLRDRKRGGVPDRNFHRRSVVPEGGSEGCLVHALVRAIADCARGGGTEESPCKLRVRGPLRTWGARCQRRCLARRPRLPKLQCLPGNDDSPLRGRCPRGPARREPRHDEAPLHQRDGR